MPISNELKTWIAENIVQGCTPQQLKPILLGLDIPEAVVEQEIAEAINHPYLKPAHRLSKQLKKRESLLKTLDAHQRYLPEYLNIKAEPLPPFDDFLKNYYRRNRPGLFKRGIDHWPALKWDFKNLVNKVGADTIVEIQQGRESNKKYEMESVQHKKKIEFGKFMEMVETAGSSNDFYLTANNQAFTNSGLSNLLKDIGDIGDGYLDTGDSAERTFLWIGPKGIITPLHHDLTDNLFVQVKGTKLFHLIPALQVPYMYNNEHVFSDVDLLEYDLAAHPEYGKVTPIEIEVNAGDILYIPIGWWHHVVGKTASISVSFTNFKVGYNYFIHYPL